VFDVTGVYFCHNAVGPGGKYAHRLC